jgi:phosphatidylglycerophosphatase A
MPVLLKVVATFFGLGYIPFIPATWTSAVAAALAWFAGDALLACTAVLSLTGFWACKGARIVFHSDDPGPFVMDEVCGMFVSLLWVPKAIPVYIVAFLLFRLFDAWKPWFIGKVQDQPGAWSIMGDDLLAGVTSNLVLQGLLHTVWRVA